MYAQVASKYSPVLFDLSRAVFSRQQCVSHIRGLQVEMIPTLVVQCRAKPWLSLCNGAE